ncbi:MAG TPA: undecaprenyl-diphosphatase UppP [Gemmatimonadaceae bacterium]|jgi:undecaprenyl-diphosphatase|nr:undecaprenyl-diphosphatase UppP [Gemmatimonadaceae bacterium]
MITTFQAIVLGLLQGLSEFLPISSSAHLALAPWLFGWPDPGLSFDVALHLGTLIAVVWYFWGELGALLQAAWQIVTTQKIVTTEQRRAALLIVGTIPGAIAGLALEHKAESTFRNPALIAGTLAVFGIILWLVDRAGRTDRSINQVGWRDAILIGLAQMFALIPGVSRSGSTITAGRALGLDRNSAAAFSFLLSVPIIAAAAVLKVPHALHESGLSLPLLAGVATSAISGWLAIKVLMQYISRHSYGAFAVYRVVLGIVMIAIYLHRG